MAKELKEKPVTVRLTPTASALWDALAERFGQSKVAVLERLLRETAETEGISLEAARAAFLEKKETAS